MRIAVGCIGHETNTFSPVTTTLENFKKGSYYRGDEIVSAFRGTRTITGGFLDIAEQLNMEPVPLLWTFATPSGMVAHAAYQRLKAEFLTLLPRARKLIALKSAVHFRADYTPIAHQILEVDTPGVHSPNLFNYNYQKLRRPIYPLDPTTTYEKTGSR